jgi:hypothetical protein
MVRPRRSWHTDDMSRPQRALVLAPLLLLVAACTAAPPPPEEPAEPFVPTYLTGIGSQETSLDVPDGAGSLHVRLACTYPASYYVSGGGDLGEDRSGPCGAMTEIVLPVHDRNTMKVSITVTPESEIAAELMFTADEPIVDARVTADCEAIGDYLSATQNAEQGYGLGELDLAGWRAGIDEARAALAGMDPSPLIEPSVEVLAAHLDTVTAPGMVFPAPPPEVARAHDLVGQVCSANGHALTIEADYGG